MNVSWYSPEELSGVVYSYIIKLVQNRDVLFEDETTNVTQLSINLKDLSVDPCDKVYILITAIAENLSSTTSFTLTDHFLASESFRIYFLS